MKHFAMMLALSLAAQSAPCIAKANEGKKSPPISYVCEGDDLAFLAGGYQSMFVGKCDFSSPASVPPTLEKSVKFADGATLFILGEAQGIFGITYLALLKPGHGLSVIPLGNAANVTLQHQPDTFLVPRDRHIEGGYVGWTCRVTVDWESEKIVAAKKIDRLDDPESDCDFS